MHCGDVNLVMSVSESHNRRMELTLHFHNTRGLALVNTLAALAAGIDRFDSSLGGLGGCPYVPGASGNVCTEELVHLLELEGCDTGVSLQGIQAARQSSRD